MSLIRKRPTSAAWQHYNDIMNFSVNMQNAIICPNTHCLFSARTLLFCLTTNVISHLMIFFLNYLITCFSYCQLANLLKLFSCQQLFADTLIV